MPPYGLYSIPRHHLYGQMRGPRPSFNSMDFIEDKASPAEADEGEHVVSIKKEKKEEKDKKDKKKRKKKKKSLDTQGEAAVIDGNEASPATTPTVPSSKEKKSKDKKKKKKEKGADDTKTSSKKRKRESDAQVHGATVLHHQVNTSSLFGTEFMNGLKATMGNLGGAFDSSIQAPASKKPLKSPTKSRSAPNLFSAAQETTKHAASDGSNNVTTPGDKVLKKRGRPPKPKPEPVPASAANPLAAAPPSQRTPQKTPVPLPQQRSQSRPARTPVPLPQVTQSRSLSEAPRSQLKALPQTSHVHVNETPQPQMGTTASGFTNTPIPFSLTSLPTTASASGKKSKKGPTVPVSSSAPTGTQDSPSKRCKVTHSQLTATGSTPLTSSNLQRYMEPLRDSPKPRPSGRAGSLGRSTSSSASSMSIKDAFLRAAKPYTENDAFLTPEKKATLKQKAKPRETHDEAGVEEFNTAMHAARATVNFTDEAAYHRTFIAWRDEAAAAGALPCLGQLTGCNTKREQMLRFSKEDASSPSLLKTLVASPADTAALASARTSTASAESLLSLSIPARIPIPLGRLDGAWHLFCPSYSDAHIDKYGFGQRTLTISKIAGFKNSASYAARLSLAPRPLPFALRTFDAPPHASFRATVLRTAVEGYAMDVVFLGNGYLVLRLDLQLLLQGKAMEEQGGKARMMEFLGVREGARRWVEEREESEAVCEV